MKDKGTLIRLRKCAQIAQVEVGESVLDLGCGDSYIRKYLPERINYTGIDKNGSNIHYDLEEGLPLEISNRKYDVVFMNEIIEHIQNFKNLLLECRQRLTPNGRLIISTPSNNRILISEDKTHIHCFRKTNMYNLATICGFELKKIRGTYIRFLPVFPHPIAIPTNQTVYTEVIIYLLKVK